MYLVVYVGLPRPFQDIPTPPALAQMDATRLPIKFSPVHVTEMTGDSSSLPGTCLLLYGKMLMDQTPVGASYGQASE